MRVIAGTYRSRPLVAPRGMETRPTSDRLRETLFNILAARTEGCRFIDLYAGSGAVGIEALSRGAAHVWFVESAAPAVKAIRANLASLKITSGYTIESHKMGSALERISQQRIEANLVFLDPPYESAAEYSNTLRVLGSTWSESILAPDALVIAEHRNKIALAERYGALMRTRVVKQGDAALSFFTAQLDSQAANREAEA